MIISGYVRFKTEKANTFIFLNKCKAAGITLKHVKITEDAVFLNVRNRDCEKFGQIANENGIIIYELQKVGLINKFKLHRKRKVFLIAALLMLMLLFLRTCFISEISVKGNNYLTDEQIISILKECGLKTGTLKFKINQRELQKSVMKKNDQLSWLWIEIKGTCAIVDVREKVLPPEFFDKNFACNVVASRDGVITQAVASGGILYAKEGTYVRKGDLLIGGVYDSSEYAPVRFVHAAGNVFAKTQYFLEDDFSGEYIKYSLDEKNKTAYGAKLFDFYFGKKVSSENTVTLNYSEKKIKIFGNFYLPLAFTKSEYCEIIKEKCKMNKEETEKFALKELSVRLGLMLPDEATVVNSQKDVYHNPDGTLHVKLTFECIENIGVESPIELEY